MGLGVNVLKVHNVLSFVPRRRKKLMLILTDRQRQNMIFEITSLLKKLNNV